MNVIGFRWGENAANLTGKLLAAIYIADPTAKEQLVKSVSIKDNRAYIDNEPLPYMFPDLEAKP